MSSSPFTSSPLAFLASMMASPPAVTRVALLYDEGATTNELFALTSTLTAFTAATPSAAAKPAAESASRHVFASPGFDRSGRFQHLR
jgi:hypothetical protein